MSAPITRAIRLIRTLYGRNASPRTTHLSTVPIFTEKHFPKFVGFAALSGLISGFAFMEYICNRQQANEIKTVYTQRRFTVLVNQYRQQSEDEFINRDAVE